MSEIRFAVKLLDEPSKSIATILCEFYDNMKSLELDEQRGGKQATLILMATNDLESIIKP